MWMNLLWWFLAIIVWDVIGLVSLWILEKIDDIYCSFNWSCDIEDIVECGERKIVFLWAALVGPITTVVVVIILVGRFIQYIKWKIKG